MSTMEDQKILYEIIFINLTFLVLDLSLSRSG